MRINLYSNWYFQRVIDRTLVEAKNKYPHLKYKRLHSAYRKFDPVRGMDYQLHFTFEDSRTASKSKSIIKRYGDYREGSIISLICFYVYLFLHFSFEAVKPLGRVEILPSPYVTESTRIAILLPTFEHQINEAMDFVMHYEKTCMEHQDNTFLMMVSLSQWMS